MEITVTTQSEFDALPNKYDALVHILIKSKTKIVVNKKIINASVEAWGDSSVEAWGDSSVVAWENSSVVARENSSVEAWGDSSVVAWENSSVVARENSSVEAWGDSSVEAWGDSSVVARENSSVVARENSCIRTLSRAASVELFSFAVAFVLAIGAKVIKKAKTATIIRPKKNKGIAGWLQDNAIAPNIANIILFKRVSKNWKTQEGTANETNWEPGRENDIGANWDPKSNECGPGTFHACSRAYFCDDFRNKPGDRYVALKVAKKDMYAWPSPSYPHKIGFKNGEVLYECDRFGRKLSGKKD